VTKAGVSLEARIHTSLGNIAKYHFEKQKLGTGTGRVPPSKHEALSSSPSTNKKKKKKNSSKKQKLPIHLCTN
jgi:hypothetical protein